MRTTLLRGRLARRGGAAMLLARDLSNLAQNSIWRFGISMGDFYFLADFGVTVLGEHRIKANRINGGLLYNSFLYALYSEKVLDLHFFGDY